MATTKSNCKIAEIPELNCRILIKLIRTTLKVAWDVKVASSDEGVGGGGGRTKSAEVGFIVPVIGLTRIKLNYRKPEYVPLCQLSSP